MPIRRTFIKAAGSTALPAGSRWPRRLCRASPISVHSIQAHRELTTGFAQKHGRPLAIVAFGRFLPASGLMAFGPAPTQYLTMTASYIDRILKGAKPGDLPIEQPSRFELALNLKTAEALAPALPQTLLFRADEVIQ